MPDMRSFPRFGKPRVEEALRDTPIVLVHGPRQCGKTTLAKEIGHTHGYTYLSFDDRNLREAAQSDPVGFVADLPPRVILDEVQRVPEIFVSLKDAVDRHRVPGRAILTGSSNVLLVPRLSDSLAGRMEVRRLHPLAQCEMAGSPSSFLDRLFSGSFRFKNLRRLGPELAERIAIGGFPPAVARASAARRREWYRNYVDSLVQRDARDLSRIDSLDALPRLLQVAAGQTSRILNVSELSAPFQLSRPTIRTYLTLLERVFLVDILPPWHNNRLSRLIKTPKIHMGDSGLAAALLGADAPALQKDRALLGQLLETMVVQELRRLASWHTEHHDFHHFRDKEGNEVDVVLERGAQALAGVEVKASSTVTAADFKGMRMLRDGAGKRFQAGVVLYDGDKILRFEEDLFAVPLTALWEE